MTRPGDFTSANILKFMNKGKHIAQFITLAYVFTILTGCSTPTPTPAPAYQPLKTRYGLSLSDAEDKALKLMPGMTQEVVQALLGNPDETSAGTYGKNTARPWQGIAWTYHWGDAKTLQILFEPENNSWGVNSWKWFDFRL
jgi:hypothetical protein